jgi:peptidoglycan/LPS O-acetylase OafA/YrhL
MNYRRDIDGLRAIAVLSVLFFHLDPIYLKAGYLGVDIFFVISGYLITRIVYTELVEGRFSYINFYVRRSKRILPPMYFMTILVLIGGYIILLPYDFFKTSISIVGAIAFVSNLQFALRTGDYFSADSSEWPMLHTWSLSVEEQYYFILPLVVIFFLRVLRINLVAVLIVIAVASFVLADYMSAQNSLASYSYYILPTRMGELLVGSVVAILHAKGSFEKIRSEAFTAFAVLIMAATLLFFDKQLVFPGFSALLVCIPVAMIIHSEGTRVNKVLANGALVWIGLLSYSLYLFHWPVLAFARYSLNTNDGYFHLPPVAQVVSLAIIAVLSIASFYLVERPLRHLKVTGIKALLLYFLIPSFALALLAAAVVLKKGLPERFSTASIDSAWQFGHVDKYKCPSLVNLGCIGGDENSEQQVVLYGNSHAEHYFELISNLAKDSNKRVSMYASGGCYLRSESAKCESTQAGYIEAIEAGVDTSVLAFRWDNSFEDEESLLVLDDLVKTAQAKSDKVIVMAQPPLLNFGPSKIENCNRLGLACPQPDSPINSLYPTFNEVVKERVQALGAEFYDPYESITDPSQLYQQDKLLYSDMDHLSVYGGRWLYEQSAATGSNVLSD